MNDVFGAIDIGTMATKLVIGRHGEPGGPELGRSGVHYLRRTLDTHIGGARIAPNGNVKPTAIGPEALERLHSTLDIFAGLLAEQGVDTEFGLRVVTTSPGRNASNVDDLAGLVVDRFGLKLEILDTNAEARLAFGGALGVLSSISDADPDSDVALGSVDRQAIMIDIGGGSTEVALGSGFTNGTESGEGLQTFSFPMGGSTVAAAYFESDPPRPEELSSALSVVGLYVDDLNRLMPELGQALAQGTPVIGVGAIVDIAAVELGLADVGLLHDGNGDGPVHGMVLCREAAEDVFRTIATEARADRVHNPGLIDSRVEEAVGVCVVLVEMMRKLSLDEITVSQHGLGHGLVSELMTYAR